MNEYTLIDENNWIIKRCDFGEDGFDFTIANTDRTGTDGVCMVLGGEELLRITIISGPQHGTDGTSGDLDGEDGESGSVRLAASLAAALSAIQLM